MSVILITLSLNVCANDKESIANKIQALKEQAVVLHKDLAQLEQDLIYPSTTQIAIYLAKRIDKALSLGSVKLSVDGTLVSTHVYTSEQNKALELGGMQRLYLGNLGVGDHVFSFEIKVFNDKDEVFIFQGQDAYYKGSQPLSLSINLSDAQGSKSPEISLIRL